MSKSFVSEHWHLRWYELIGTGTGTAIGTGIGIGTDIGIGLSIGIGCCTSTNIGIDVVI
jgi:hypothetical protein